MCYRGGMKMILEKDVVSLTDFARQTRKRDAWEIQRAVLFALVLR